ncbi:hypothetical protein [Thermococcus waiotapuensis]|uniref:Uncharacterized protein n=1 Tax=Thermococcus waiotapuensis TaxID=90909 RepID=A0AAE4NTF4_9EURY|nr:hypothetical protein [Thermococcus waiotapuensis]MDV3102957.1 hypothetical protein [Thermococcus waiotapuensis]
MKNEIQQPCETLKDSVVVVSKAFRGGHFTERSSDVLRLLWKAGIVGD